MIAGVSLFTENGTLLFTDYTKLDIPPQSVYPFIIITPPFFA